MIRVGQAGLQHILPASCRAAATRHVGGGSRLQPARTPAMAANVTDRLWLLEELVDRTSIAAHEHEPAYRQLPRGSAPYCFRSDPAVCSRNRNKRHRNSKNSSAGRI